MSKVVQGYNAKLFIGDQEIKFDGPVDLEIEEFGVKLSRAERYAKATQLRKQANDLIEDLLPLMWKDGDVRYIASSTFKVIEDLMREATALELSQSRLTQLEVAVGRRMKLVFLGQFGEIEIRDAKQLREVPTEES